MTLMEIAPDQVGHGGRCNSLVKQGPGRCRKSAGWGTEHVGIGACKLHGGSTPSHVTRAERIRLAQSIGELVELHRPELSGIDPHEALLEVVGDTWALRRCLWGLVEQLTPRGGRAYREADDAQTPDGVRLVELAPAEPAGLYGVDHSGDAAPHVLVRMLHDATREHLQACKLAIDAGIEQRRIELAEGQAQQLADVLRAGMAGLLDAVRQLGVLDGPVLRQLEDQVPALLRGAIDRARVIDVPNERTS